MRSERRKYARVSVGIVANCIRYRTTSNKKDYFLAYTKDVSQQGVCLVATRKVEVGDIIEVGLVFPGRLIPHHIDGTVAWIRDCTRENGPPSSVFEIGMEFKHIYMREAEKLQEFIMHKLEKIKCMV